MNPPSALQGLNTAPPKRARELWRHFSDTYFSIRLGLALLAAAFSPLLYGWGQIRHGLELQNSMSAYFWAAAASQCASFPMRTFLVGVLIAIAACLYLYKGLTKLENLLLNGAAACAVVVAVMPERLDTIAPTPRVKQLYANCPAIEQWALSGQPGLPYHYLAAVGLFVLLFIVAWFCASKSLEYLPPNSPLSKQQFTRLYRGIALAMPIVGVIGGTFVYLHRNQDSPATFWLETGEIIVFALYWGLKTYEMSLTQLEADPQVAVNNAAASGAGTQAGPEDGTPA